MTLPTAPASPLDQVFTRFAFHKIGGSEYKDQKFFRRPLLHLLDERSLPGSGGGPNIVHPIDLGTSFNGTSLSRNQEFSISGDSAETWSRYTWSTVIETCFVSWWDIREADGNAFKMESILNSRIDQTRENLEDNLATQLSQSSAASSDDINPILSIVASTGATGNLNPSTSGQGDWAARTTATVNWTVEGVGRARTLISEVEDRKGTTDVILAPNQFHNETLEIGDAALVINDDARTRGGTKIANLGLKVPFILNTPVIRDTAWNTAQTSTVVGMDLSGIHLVCDPKWDMYMYPFKEMAHHGRLGQASVQVKVAQLTCSSRRTQFSMTSVS